MAVANDAARTLPELDATAVETEIRNGDLLLCSGNQPFSKLIRWATKSPWSHIALAMRDEAVGRVMVLESVEKIGVRTIPFQTFVFGEHGKHPYPGQIILTRHAKIAAAPPADLKRMAQFAVDELGDPFDGFEVLKIAARIALGKFDRKMPEMMTAKNEYICSEYVAECFQKIGVKPHWDGRGFIAPSDFASDPDLTGVARVRMRA
jgi:hypothetical protein